MKFVKVTLPIFIQLSMPVESSTRLTPNPQDSCDIPKFLENIGNIISDALIDNGFQPDTRFNFTQSKLNGGYSLYTTYDYRDSAARIVLDVDIRLSDHASKPNLSTSVKRSIDKLNQKNSKTQLGDANAAVLDIYCKQHNWGVQIYFGTEADTDYRTPFSSVSAFERMLNGKLSKLISKYGA